MTKYQPIIAVTAAWNEFPERFDWIREQGLALEYTLNPLSLQDVASHLAPSVSAGQPVRFHGKFPGFEFGHADKTLAETGMKTHLDALDAIAGYEAPVITLHIGLARNEPIDPRRAGENLARLVARGKSLGVTVCIENLCRGISSDAGQLTGWAENSGALITVDIGHAYGCAPVMAGRISVTDYIEPLLPRTHEAHVYGIETDRHYPPAAIGQIAPALDKLLLTKCRWWTIELDRREDITATRARLDKYLELKESNNKDG
jgi:sugar phosphate isomerase/epimerase